MEESKIELEWMWGDAGLVDVPFFNWFAKKNPFRWQRGLPLFIADALDYEYQKEKEKHREVLLRAAGEKYTYMFPDAKSARDWIREAVAIANNFDGVECYPSNVSYSNTSSGRVCRRKIKRLVEK